MTTPDDLTSRVRDVLDIAHAAFADHPDQARVDAIAERLDEPLRVAVAGKVKAGKSTLLNALVGEELAPTDAGECTRLVTWYRNGHTYRVELHRNDGSTRQVPFQRDAGALDIDLQGVPLGEIDHLDVTWPSQRLAELTLIDTPGLGSLSSDVSARSEAFLALDDDAEPTEVDAVIYLMRHLHHSDLDFLEAFHDSSVGQPSPINAVAVLSRADEVGSCRLDALTAAQRVARRLRAEPRMRQLCQTVVPVAGLLAQAAMTLTESQYRALRAVAELPAETADALLLTVDRLVDPADDAVPVADRVALLDRLGLFGVRTSVSLIRLGAADTAGALAEKLRERSGISELRELLLTLFSQRRDILKAQAALSGLEALVMPSDVPERAAVLAAIERVSAGAHELVEVELMQTIRQGQLPFTDAEQAELDRLYSNIGGTPSQRLGVDVGDVREHAVAAIGRWRQRGENPLASRDLATTARAIVRSYEGLLAEHTS